MKLTSCFLTLGLLAPLAGFSREIQAEAGVSYFAFQNARFESQPPLATDEPDRAAPFVAVTCALNDRLGLRLSYHFINDARATAQFGSPPGSLLPVVVWGHYDDDIHVSSLAPEINFRLAPTLTLAVAPQLNWVASRGVVSFSTTDPLILLVGPRKRTEDGFTLGGSTRLLWSLGSRTALSLGYQYVNLNPSFDREAHVISGGLQWRF